MVIFIPMSYQDTSTAILVFALSAREESIYKSLNTEEPKNLRMLRELNRLTSENVVKSGIPAFYVNENLQRGESFGERLANALEDVFKKGYERILIIGNDSPDLTTGDLLKAKSILSDNEIVLGPDYRGGAYLIGIQKCAYNRESFLAFKWQSHQFLDSFIAWINTKCYSCHILSKKADFNKAEDLHYYQFISATCRRLASAALSAHFMEHGACHVLYSPIAAVLRRGP